MTKSKDIKSYLREQGIETKNIRITTDSSINVKILDPKLNFDQIETLLRDKYESYQRDKATGEILSGGNTFVFIEYDQNIVKEISEQLYPTISPFLEKCSGRWSIASLVKHYVESQSLEYDVHLTKRAIQEALYLFLKENASNLGELHIEGWN